MVLLRSLISLIPGEKKSGLEFVFRQLFVVVIFSILYWISGYVHKWYPEYDPVVRMGWETKEDLKKRDMSDPWSFYDCFYFSLVTQTTVGYGDLAPRTRLMRGICMLQLLTIYGVLAVSWL